jgi:sarcosine oxidase subunit beta
MHQPRNRVLRETARAFAENPLGVFGADFVNDPTNQGLGYSQIRVYEEISRHRFENIDQSVYSSGYKSYFDITPDLKFILGPDCRVSNLVHCLGAGRLSNTRRCSVKSSRTSCVEDRITRRWRQSFRSLALTRSI